MSHRAKFDGGPLDGQIKELPDDYSVYKALELVQPPFILNPNYTTYPINTACKYVEHKYFKSTLDPHIYWYSGSDYLT